VTLTIGRSKLSPEDDKRSPTTTRVNRDGKPEPYAVLAARYTWKNGRLLSLGDMLLQPRDLCWGPIANIRHLDPCVDVVRWGVDMAVTDRRCGRHELVHRQLKKAYNRVLPQLRGHVRAARRQHPVWFAIEAGFAALYCDD
jgi:hypothetical protein